MQMRIAMTHNKILLALTLLSISVTAHANTTPITLNFGAVAKTTTGKMSAVNCQDSYVFGTQKTAANLADLRFYVSNIKVITTKGQELPVTLASSHFAQNDVGLIDLENGTGSCANRGNKDTNTQLTGTVLGHYQPNELAGIRFEVGVPTAKNHTLFSNADAPLNIQAMSWAWLAGRKFMKVELAVKEKVRNLSDGTSAPLYNVHFGRTGCTGEPATGTIECTHDNKISVKLMDKRWQQKTIELDLNALFAKTNIAQNQSGAVGCMSAEADKDCASIFANTGLKGGTQSIFRLSKK